MLCLQLLSQFLQLGVALAPLSLQGALSIGERILQGRASRVTVLISAVCRRKFGSTLEDEAWGFIMYNKSG